MKQINLRLDAGTVKKIDKAVKASPLYASRNHFIMLAVLSFLLNIELTKEK